MYFGKILTVLLLPGFLIAQTKSSDEMLVTRTLGTATEISSRSFPVIKREKLRIKTFRSRDTFFKARFSLVRFLTFQRMRHLIYVNPEAFQRSIPENAFRAILAHELAHVAYYTRKNRLQLIGLVRIAKTPARTAFERKADFEAIVRGYGPGLIEYREWLYKQIPPEQISQKKKVYFSPDEIRLLIRATSEYPALIEKWRNNIPRDIQEIKRDTGYD